MPGQGAAAAAYVCGTFDTKAAELHYLADLLRAAGLRTLTVDLGTREPSSDTVMALTAAPRSSRPSTAWTPSGCAAATSVAATSVSLLGSLVPRSTVNVRRPAARSRSAR